MDVPNQTQPMWKQIVVIIIGTFASLAAIVSIPYIVDAIDESVDERKKARRKKLAEPRARVAAAGKLAREHEEDMVVPDDYSKAAPEETPEKSEESPKEPEPPEPPRAPEPEASA